MSLTVKNKRSINYTLRNGLLGISLYKKFLMKRIIKYYSRYGILKHRMLCHSKRLSMQRICK